MNYFPVGKKVKKQEFIKMLTTMACELNRLPTPYTAYPPASAIVYRNEIHLLGGRYSTTLHKKIDAKTDAVINVGTLPFEFDYGSAVVLNDELHLLGSNKEPNKHYKWDGETWTEVSTIPFDVSYTVAAALNNEIHLIGGANHSMVHYKWDGETWTELGTVPLAYSSQKAAVVVNGEIHYIAGVTGSGSNFKHYKWDGENWIELESVPFAITYKEAATDGNAIYVRGNSGGYSTWTESAGWVDHIIGNSVSFGTSSCNVYFGGWHSFWNGPAGSTSVTYHAVVGVPIYIPIDQKGATWN